MFFNTRVLILCLLFLLFNQCYAQEKNLEYDLECISATDDWYVHINVFKSQLEIFTTSVWNARKEYFKGTFQHKDSSAYRAKELNYTQHCYEISDSQNLMNLKYCTVIDENFYKVDAKDEQKIQEMYQRGYEFGLGEIEFLKVPALISSGTVFYCFKKVETSFLTLHRQYLIRHRTWK